MRAKLYDNYNIKIAYMQDCDKKLIELGNHIKNLRKKQNLSLENLCYKNGLEPSTVSRIENGIVEPKYLTLLKLAKAYKMPIKDFLDF